MLAAESVTLVPLDGTEARAVGHLCGATGAADIADVSVALVARRTGGVAVTSDPDDLREIDPGLDLVIC